MIEQKKTSLGTLANKPKWEVVLNKLIKRDYSTYIVGASIIERDTDKTIAIVHNTSENFLEKSQLMASAPELLEACKMALWVFRKIIADHDLPEHVTDYIIVELEQVIKKAEDKKCW